MLLQSLMASRVADGVILEAFAKVPREAFVPEAFRDRAYADEALPLEEGATISQPSMLAITLREMKLEPGVSVLEVGSGCGYMLALLDACGAEPTGIEIIPALAQKSRETLAKIGANAEVIQGDAAHARPETRFDRVVFSAAVQQVPPWAFELISEDGFVLAPVGVATQQQLVRAYKDHFEHTGQLCRFVPFVQPN